MTYLPTRKQALAHKAIERYTLFGGAKGGGKSTWLCTELRELLLETSSNVGFIGRWESTTFLRTTFITLMHYFTPEIILKHSPYEKKIELINNSILYYGGLKPTQASAPIDKFKSMELGCFALDEATEPPEDIFLALAGCLRLQRPGIRLRGLLASNPERGWVKDRFVKQNLPDHIFIQALPRDNPNLPPDYEEKLLELYPPEWVQKYLKGDWDFSIEDYYVFNYSLLDEATNRICDPSGPISLGIDFARTGKDSSVIAKTQNGHNTILYSSPYTEDTMSFCGIVGNFIDELRPTRVVCDTVGLGGPAFDRIREVNGDKTECIAYVGGSTQVRDKSRYLNVRAESYFDLKQKLINGADLPEVAKRQASTIKYEIYSDKVIKLEPKENMKKSPDEMDAIVMANYFDPAEQMTGRVVQFSGKERQDNENTQRKRNYRIGAVR